MSAGYVVFPHLIADARDWPPVFDSTLYQTVSLTVLAGVVVFPSVFGIRQGLRLATHRPFIQTILRAGTIATLAMLFAISVVNLWRVTGAFTHPLISDGATLRLKSVARFGVYWPLVYLVVVAVARCRQSRGAAEIPGT